MKNKVALWFWTFLAISIIGIIVKVYLDYNGYGSRLVTVVSIVFWVITMAILVMLQITRRKAIREMNEGENQSHRKK